MSKEIEKIDAVLDKLSQTLKTVAQGRKYNVGTLVLYKGRLGVVTHLNKDATDPVGSSVDIRMDDGTVYPKVSVKASSLQFFRSE